MRPFWSPFYVNLELIRMESRSSPNTHAMRNKHQIGFVEIVDREGRNRGGKTFRT